MLEIREIQITSNPDWVKVHFVPTKNNGVVLYTKPMLISAAEVEAMDLAAGDKITISEV